MTTPPAGSGVPREERRRRTEAVILDAARELFARTGFERTTIRAVAARAGVDPALVMQYYVNKEGLFAAAATWSDEDQRVVTADRDELPRAALADLFSHFERVEDRAASVALMRNCLTHPGAAALMRDEVMCDRAAAVAGKMTGDEAELRAGLFAACVMGLGMARYLLEIEPVRSASHEDLVRLMEPVLRVLVDPPS
ncbi:MAG: transcriptional regulator, TetR family [Frankiales bacterium]|jgi:AcrR family transcriptional regulator|nr:transcriptional regulator, TetR family [Frankiales bacterium]